MAMKNPPHPGQHIRMDCLDPLELTVTAGAKALGVTRQALNNLVNEKIGNFTRDGCSFRKAGLG